MKIETLTNLIGGELINRPYISEVVSFTDNFEEVSRGSCFFANNEDEIKEAVKNGAYAIITPTPTKIIDTEIAWIICEDFKKAIFNIFKYENLQNKIYFTDKITSMIIKKMNLEKKVVVVEREEDLLKALNFKEKYIVTSIKKFLDIFPNVEILKKKEIDLIQDGLFRSKFEGIEINLPFVYKDSFSKAINFFEKFNLKKSLEFSLDRFRPIFINYKFEEVEFGNSEKVLITGIKNDEMFFDELNYIIENTKHAKTIFVNKKEYLNKEFNFAVLVDFEIELNKREEKRLFDD